MKTLILILFSTQIFAQNIVATINLSDNTFINNAPSGRTWKDYKATGIVLHEESDTLIIHNSEIDKINYYGNWSISDKNLKADSNNCYCSFSRQANDSLVFKFTNISSFEWYGERMKHQGIADIYFNDKLDTTINTYSLIGRPPSLNYFKYNLDTNKVYKFKLVVTGRKGSAATGSYIVNQYFRLIHTGQPVRVDPPPDIPLRPFYFSIVRSGRFQIFLDGVQHGNEHNEYEKSIEHAIRLKSDNPGKNVVIKSPIRKIELK